MNVCIELKWSEFVISILNGPQENVRYIPMVENSGSFMAAIADLANQKGGLAVIGFDKSNYQLHGVRFEKSWLKAVIEKEIAPLLDFEIKTVIRNRKTLYIVEVLEGQNKPYQSSRQQSIPEIKPLPILDEIIKTESEPIIKVATPKPIITTIITEEFIPDKKDENKKTVIKETVEEPSDNLSAREKKCLAFLNENNEITNTIYRELNGVSHKTAHNELAHLVKTGILRKEGQGRTTKYCLISGKNTENTFRTVEKDIPKNQEPSLFGDDIGEVISKINPSVSITDIRKASQSPHMNSHFNENNDIGINFNPAGDDSGDDFIEETIPIEEEPKSKTNNVFEDLNDGDDLLKQLAELYEQIKS